MSKLAHHLYEFGPFRLYTGERLLLRDGQSIQLTPKAFDTLVLLVENGGHVVEKATLLEAVWPDTFVDENTLTRNISTLRKALGQDGNGHQYIETVPKLGYRFVADVREIRDQSAYVVLGKSIRSHIVIEEETDGAGQETKPAQTFEHSSLKQSQSVNKAFRLRSNRAVLVVSILLIGITLATFVWISSRSKQSITRAPARSIAVLPFKTLGAQGNDEYLGLGLADALITRLGNLKQIVVRPTTAMQKFAGNDQDPVAAGRELGVEVVLDGHVQRSGDTIRVTVQLLSAKDGAQLWTGKFDGQYNGIFAVQDSISNQVAQAMAPNLTGEEREYLTKHYTENVDAYHAYLKGRYFWNQRTPAAVNKAIGYFQQAIDTDPNYAQAYVGLADCYAFSVESPKSKAKEYLVKALELDDTLAEAHASLAFQFKFCEEWDWAGAEKEFKRAIELNANYPTAHQWYAYDLAATGRLNDAITEIKRAHELDPLSIIVNTDVGEFLYFARRYDQAIEQYRKSLEMDPNFVVAHYLLGFAYEQKGLYEEAIGEHQKALALLGNDRTKGWLGHAYAVSGKKVEAVKILDELKELLKGPGHRGYGFPFSIASIYSGLGDKDQAFEWLEKAYEDHNYYPIYVTLDPRFDSLRSDPRFAELLRRMGLPS